MSIDDMVIRDPRVAVLGKLCGWNRWEALGHLLDVWSACYDRATPNLAVSIVDACVGLEGFAGHMVEAELATLEKDGKIRVSGVESRITYLTDKYKAGRKGGVKSGESRRNKLEAESKQNACSASSKSNPNTNTNPTANPKEVQSVSGKPDAFQAGLGLGLTEPEVQLAEVAVAEINRLRGSRYESTSAAILKDCKSLSKEKRTADQVKAVIASKAKWIGDPKMGEQFKPSVLLRPSNFAKYLDDVNAVTAAHGTRYQAGFPVRRVCYVNGREIEIPEDAE